MEIALILGQLYLRTGFVQVRRSALVLVQSPTENSSEGNSKIITAMWKQEGGKCRDDTGESRVKGAGRIRAH
jgi:hypothetical protein